MPTQSEDFWRKAINNLPAESLESGTGPPEVEIIKTSSKKRIRDGERKVLVQKMITEMYVFTDVTGKVYSSLATQKLQILGEMTLEEGLKRAKEDSA